MSYKKYVWRGGPPAWQLRTGPWSDYHQEKKSLIFNTWVNEQRCGIQRFKPEFVLWACLLLLRLGLGKYLELLEIAETPVPEFNEPALPSGEIRPVELKTVPAYVAYLAAEEKRRQTTFSRQFGSSAQDRMHRVRGWH